MKSFLSLVVAVLLAGTVQARPLKVGTLPVGEGLPLWFASERGFFRQEGVQVEVVPFQSAMERDMALQTGAVDGAVHDLVGTLLARRAGLDLRVLTAISRPTEDDPLFSLVASPGSGIEDLRGLEGRRVAISRDTVIEYVLDGLLKGAGVRVRKVEVKKIPLRLQMLLGGQVSAAVLPEPLASVALNRGGRRLAGDGGLKGTEVVLVFRGDVLRSAPSQVEAFGRAWRRAVGLLLSKPEEGKALLLQKARVPKGVEYFPLLCPVGLPPEGDLEAVKGWLKQRGLRVPLSYDELVDPCFLGTAR